MANPQQRFPTRQQLLDFRGATYLLSTLNQYSSQAGAAVNLESAPSRSRARETRAYKYLTHFANLLVRYDESLAVMPSAKKGGGTELLLSQNPDHRRNVAPVKGNEGKGKAKGQGKKKSPATVPKTFVTLHSKPADFPAIDSSKYLIREMYQKYNISGEIPLEYHAQMVLALLKAWHETKDADERQVIQDRLTLYVISISARKMNIRYNLGTESNFEEAILQSMDHGDAEAVSGETLHNRVPSPDQREFIRMCIDGHITKGIQKIFKAEDLEKPVFDAAGRLRILRLLQRLLRIFKKRLEKAAKIQEPKPGMDLGDDFALKVDAVAHGIHWFYIFLDRFSSEIQDILLWLKVYFEIKSVRQTVSRRSPSPPTTFPPSGPSGSPYSPTPAPNWTDDLTSHHRGGGSVPSRFTSPGLLAQGVEIEDNWTGSAEEEKRGMHEEHRHWQEDQELIGDDRDEDENMDKDEDEDEDVDMDDGDDVQDEEALELDMLAFDEYEGGWDKAAFRWLNLCCLYQESIVSLGPSLDIARPSSVSDVLGDAALKTVLITFDARDNEMCALRPLVERIVGVEVLQESYEALEHHVKGISKPDQNPKATCNASFHCETILMGLYLLCKDNATGVPHPEFEMTPEVLAAFEPNMVLGTMAGISKLSCPCCWRVMEGVRKYQPAVKQCIYGGHHTRYSPVALPPFLSASAAQQVINHVEGLLEDRISSCVTHWAETHVGEKRQRSLSAYTDPTPGSPRKKLQADKGAALANSAHDSK